MPNNKKGHYIGIGFHLNERLGITAVTIDENTTDLASDSKLLRLVCVAALRGLYENSSDIQVQDLLNELNIKTL